MRCEDYPCCGHTNDDPCGPQPYDAPDYYDTTVNPHALCDHQYGECDVWDDEVDPADCEHGDRSCVSEKDNTAVCDICDSDCAWEPEPSGMNDTMYTWDDGGEDRWLDGSYEE